jgi:hypothetical protein
MLSIYHCATLTYCIHHALVYAYMHQLFAILKVHRHACYVLGSFKALRHCFTVAYTIEVLDTHNMKCIHHAQHESIDCLYT